MSNELRRRLATLGLSEHEVGRKLQHFDRAEAVLRAVAGPARRDAALARLWVPGRIEVLGKHTDYAGGRSLLCAVERGFSVVAAPRRDQVLAMHDAVRGESIRIALDTPPASAPGQWSAYPLTVARRIAANFGRPLVGADVAFASDLPQAAGISSSSALVVATFLALAAVNHLERRDAYRRALPTTEALAEYLGAVENGLSYGELAADHGVGTFGGSEDHTAILCARAQSLVQYSFCPVEHEATVPLDGGRVFVVVSSGVVAEKTGAALEHYNRVASLAQAALRRWRHASARDDASLGAAVRSASGSGHAGDAVIGAMQRAAGTDDAADPFTSDELAERVRQFVVESEELIPAAGLALRERDVAAFGAIVDRSMRNAVDLLHNQIDETIYLARRARELGADAASAFGAGFGGSVWCLVDATRAENFRAALLADYCRRFPEREPAADAFVTRASGPAAVLTPLAAPAGA